mmetsp:Transcript_45663/g.76069  ORF Transcript_45663/g.76069 Transcript_45663/m.76069 type:complete len:96 (+) Transcript_45663:43-330(+)
MITATTGADSRAVSRIIVSVVTGMIVESSLWLVSFGQEGEGGDSLEESEHSSCSQLNLMKKEKRREEKPFVVDHRESASTSSPIATTVHEERREK